MLKNLNINGWNQFASVDIQFHPKVTILTGANGAGKSTLFRMLSRDMGWSYSEISSPVKNINLKNNSTFIAGLNQERLEIGLKKILKNEKERELNPHSPYRNNFYRTNNNDFDHFNQIIRVTDREKKKLVEIEFLDNIHQEIQDPYSHINENFIDIGKIETEEGFFTYHVPLNIEDSSYVFSTKYEPLEYYKLKKIDDRTIGKEEDFINSLIKYLTEAHANIPGISIPSHRHPYTYEKIDSIPVHAPDTKELLKKYFENIQNRTLNFSYSDTESPIITMKKSIISLAVFSEKSKYVEGNNSFKKIIDRFNEILKLTLPKHIKFKSLYIGSGEVVLETDSGNFLLDAVSGGIGALIDIVWQIFLVDNELPKYVVLIDELENHLHPSMQREVLPNLINNFPKAQFVISTHSPFIINSVIDCNIYALTYNGENKVETKKLDFIENSTDAFSVLKEVLGVSVTMPIWLEKELEDTLNQLENKTSTSLTIEDYNKIKESLSEKGLENKLPDILNILLENKND